MKTIGIMRIFTLASALFLSLVLIPATPALAARMIDINPQEGRIGDDIDIEGAGFPTDDPAGIPPYDSYADIYFAYRETAISAGHDIDDEVKTYELVKEKVDCGTGSFSTHFEIPSRLIDGSTDDDVRGGTYYVCATLWGETDIKAVAEFTVTAGEITDFDPTDGSVGTEVSISGQNFGEREGITIKYDGSSIDIESGDTETDKNGDFGCTIIIPPSTAGDHTVTVMDETITEVEDIFEVVPEMSFTPTQAPPGDTVEVSGTGFGGNTDVDIYLGTDSVATKKADRDGSFTVSFMVPEVDEGTYSLVAEDDDGNDYKASFIVEIGIEATIRPVTSTAAPGYVGQSVTVSGVRFEANSTIIITYATDPQVIATTTSNAEGDFTATFDIPKSEAGAHIISASDGTNSLEVPFYMEAQAPGTPELLLPEMGTKAPSMAQFDWESVEDPSGVTYELQVATSDDFAAASMVLEMMGLTDSEYTLTKEEALPSRSEEEPYYWRVRAVDGAANTSGWADAGTFHVGFAWPDWIIHLWWGLGTIGAIFFGYFLGKRRVYY